MEKTAELLRRCTQVEDFLWPQPGNDWLDQLVDIDQAILVQLTDFRKIIRRWQAAIALPIDQLVHTITQDLISDPVELAVCHKLALILRRALDDHPTWRLPELTSELAVIARNERRFLGFSEDDLGFNPDEHPGVVVVSTLHKSKGLEWDRVYLISVNNYDFPSGVPGDQFLSEKWFLRDKLNLEAEVLAQLQSTMSADIYEWYQEGEATKQARLDYVRERLRLLYVGITRAKKELVITWNTGRFGNLRPALPLRILSEYLTGKKDDIT
jgi:DNA helicase-2/ATP-dependent DNA helicase PcrA